MEKLRIALMAGLLALTLASCGGGEESSSAASVSESGAESSAPSSSSAAGETITNDDLAKGATSYTFGGVEYELNRTSIYTNANSPHVDTYHDSEDAPHVLVAGFTFSDSSPIEATDALLAKIEMAFTATDEELDAVSGGGIYSVESFYHQSSFGKGDLSFTVLPVWVTYEGTPSDFLSAADGSAGLYAAEYVRSWYIAEYAKDSHGSLGADAEPLTYFDNNGDGWLDLMWTVYTYPSAADTDWWAYVTYSGNAKSESSPTVMTIGWASTDFMSSYNGYDTHTFIHETGHTLGCDDYYDYNKNWSPMGGIDYMDQNLGDHNAWTKFSYGWVNPWVVTEDDLEGGKTAVVTLRAQTLSGDCLVLASPGYNGTAFDEFLMLELVGPYGLAENDYKKGYQGTTGFTEPGIRILHVDARVYAGEHDTYLKDAATIGTTATAVRLGNTSNGGRIGLHIDGDYFPVEASDGTVTKSYMSQCSIIESTVDSDDNWTKSATYKAGNDSLFRANGRFTLSNNSAWAKNFMPSKSNLWNKAKTITGWDGNTQTYEIDETCTCDYYVKVLSIEADDTYGAVAQVSVTLA